MDRNQIERGWRVETWTGPHNEGGKYLETIAVCSNFDVARAAFEATKKAKKRDVIYLCNRALVIDEAHPE